MGSCAQVGVGGSCTRDGGRCVGWAEWDHAHSWDAQSGTHEVAWVGVQCIMHTGWYTQVGMHRVMHTGRHGRVMHM